MKNTVTKIFVLLVIAHFAACSNDGLVPSFEEIQEPGRIVIRGYNAAADSVQISINGKLLQINDETAFVNEISKDFDFVYFGHEPKNINIINKTSGDTLQSYAFTDEVPTDTLSFYVKPKFYINNVLSFEQGTLSQPANTGYRFIFPTLNLYSNTGYEGALDGIIRKTNGQQLGVVENITKTGLSAFVEFPYSSPPIIKMELVKHGTTESYIPGQQVFVTMVMANNKSRLVVLEEVANDAGTFASVNGTIDLVDFFEF